MCTDAQICTHVYIYYEGGGAKHKLTHTHLLKVSSLKIHAQTLLISFGLVLQIKIRLKNNLKSCLRLLKPFCFVEDSERS